MQNEAHLKLHLQETRKIDVLKLCLQDSTDVGIVKVSLCPKQFLGKSQFQMHLKLQLLKIQDLERLQLKMKLIPIWKIISITILVARYMVW